MLNSIFIENKIKAFWNSPFTRWFTNQPVRNTYIIFIWGLAFLNSFHWNKLYPSVHLSWFRFLWLVFTGLTQRLSNKKKFSAVFITSFCRLLRKLEKTMSLRLWRYLIVTGHVHVLPHFYLFIYRNSIYIFSIDMILWSCFSTRLLIGPVTFSYRKHLMRSETRLRKL